MVEGGDMYYGVSPHEESKHKVFKQGKYKGFPLQAEDKEYIKNKLTEFFTERLQNRLGIQTQWELNFPELRGSDPPKTLVHVRVEHVPGGVYEDDPESYTLNDGGDSERMERPEWEENILMPNRDNQADTDILEFTDEKTFIPNIEVVVGTYGEVVKKAASQICALQTASSHVVMTASSWLKLLCDKSLPDELICDILVISKNMEVSLTSVIRGTMAKASHTRYVRETCRMIKTRLLASTNIASRSASSRLRFTVKPYVFHSNLLHAISLCDVPTIESKVKHFFQSCADASQFQTFANLLVTISCGVCEIEKDIEMRRMKQLTKKRVEELLQCNMTRFNTIEGPWGADHLATTLALVERHKYGKLIVITKSIGIKARIQDIANDSTEILITDTILEAVRRQSCENPYSVIYINSKDDDHIALFDKVQEVNDTIFVMRKSPFDQMQTEQKEVKRSMCKFCRENRVSYNKLSLVCIHQTSQKMVEYAKRTLGIDTPSNIIDDCIRSESSVMGEDICLYLIDANDDDAIYQHITHRVNIFTASRVVVLTDDAESRDSLRKALDRTNISQATLDDPRSRSILLETLSRFDGLDEQCVIYIVSRGRMRSSPMFMCSLAARATVQLDIVVTITDGDMNIMDLSNIADKIIDKTKRKYSSKNSKQGNVQSVARGGELMFKSVPENNMVIMSTSRRKPNTVTIHWTGWDDGRRNLEVYGTSKSTLFDMVINILVTLRNVRIWVCNKLFRVSNNLPAITHEPQQRFET